MEIICVTTQMSLFEELQWDGFGVLYNTPVSISLWYPEAVEYKTFSEIYIKLKIREISFAYFLDAKPFRTFA